MKAMRMLGWTAAALLCAGMLYAAEGGKPEKPAKPQAGERKGPCKDDIEKFCKDVQQGGGRIKDCLKQHEAELSDACKKRGEQAHERRANRREAVKEACKGDVEKLCKGVEPGEGRIVKCLKDHEADLSEGCKTLSERAQEARQKMAEAHEACKGDAEKFCKDVEPGEGRIAKCLKANEALLSEGCKKVGEDARERREERREKREQKKADKKDKKGEQKEETQDATK